ncbi:MAG: peptide chain release factor N(5)-glutamine methyltransferase [Geobacter sp.]|nr:peptide chain release factor N(5)-glutamine methyltransferase [Geobacter sp.]
MEQKAETWTTLKVLTWTKEYLANKGVENARLEAEWLLCEALALDRVGLYLNFDTPLSDAELASFRQMVARRAKREPLQHILGTQEFMGLEFKVSPAVLIPRHDTETLLQEALRVAPQAATALDIGSGSGCVAIALAKNLAGAAVISVDIAADALELAAQNAALNGVQVDFRHGSMFEPVQGESFDLIVSNPPYIPTADLAGLEPEVRDFEPRTALDGGVDGLNFYRQIVAQAPEHLSPRGWLLVEVGIGQDGQVKELFASAGFSAIFTAKDPGGIERVVGGQII